MTRFGKVRRAKLYYLRELTGKKARIKERIIRKNKTVKSKTATVVSKAVESKLETDNKPSSTEDSKKKAVVGKKTETTKEDPKNKK